LGHVTRKIVSEMTYNVSSGTLNSTIPYHIARTRGLSNQTDNKPHISIDFAILSSLYKQYREAL